MGQPTRPPWSTPGLIRPSRRLTVRRVLEIVDAYGSRDEIKVDYPELQDEDIVQALGYAAAMLEDAIVALPKTA